MDELTIQRFYPVFNSLRNALRALADNPERSADEIRERLAEMIGPIDQLCDDLKPQTEEES